MPEDIATCPVCKGWGFKQLPLNSDITPCDYCAGKSMQYTSDEFYLSWDIPPFVDFGKRKANKTKKIVLTVFAVVIMLLAIIMLIYLFNSLNIFK